MSGKREEKTGEDTTEEDRGGREKVGCEVT